MLRVAIPYGLLSSLQLRTLAGIARRYDRGYGHFTTRQNMQYNWPKLEDVPDILAELASVEMHAIQTSGNCIRNITSDHLAGVTPDELEDPRPWCEIIRQWSTFHPEFSFLPRKFKIAVTGSRAGPRRDAGARRRRAYRARRRTASRASKSLPAAASAARPSSVRWCAISCRASICCHIWKRSCASTICEGRRDNLTKARIKILVKSLGIEEFRRRVEAEWESIKDNDGLRVNGGRYRAYARIFSTARLSQLGRQRARGGQSTAFRAWYRYNTSDAQGAGLSRRVRLVEESRCRTRATPPRHKWNLVADLADRYSFGEIRVTHTQNLLLADVEQEKTFELWQALDAAGLATPNIGTLTDMICCPGLDFCSLANAGSIEVAKLINERFDDYDYIYDLGEIDVKMSGCMNACGHHHVGNIGILGVDKGGEEWYQITIGGAAGADASLGTSLARRSPRLTSRRRSHGCWRSTSSCVSTMSGSSIPCGVSA